MNLIKSSFEIIEQPSGMEGLFKHIELAGRCCYKSQDKITEDSAKRFVEGLIKSGHGSVLEHGTIYLKETSDCMLYNVLRKYLHNKFSKFNWVSDKENSTETAYVTTNYRVLLENDWLDDLKYMCEPTEYHEKRVTVRFNCDIGVSREFNRHRVNSISEQSTRYCNYTKKKFGGGLNIIFNDDVSDINICECVDEWDCYREDGSLDENTLFRRMCYEICQNNNDLFEIVDTWLFANLASQWSYNRLIELGWKPQQARRVLPLGTATELIHTAFVSDWKHFFELRDHSAAHPQAIELAKPLHEEFIKRNLV